VVGDAPDHHINTAADDDGRAAENGPGEGGREPHDSRACAVTTSEACALSLRR